jgi:hypothetical protein
VKGVCAALFCALRDVLVCQICAVLPHLTRAEIFSAKNAIPKHGHFPSLVRCKHQNAKSLINAALNACRTAAICVRNKKLLD